MDKSKSTNPIEGVPDTARWVAYYRALESDRPDALFKDPFARILAGEKGHQITKYIDQDERHAWALAVRTAIIDDAIIRIMGSERVDTILNLACGLDTRPYRLNLPSQLQWIEVDFPSMISYKQKIMIREKPTCKLEQIPLDLTQEQQRGDLFGRINSNSKRVLVITEGLLGYLTEAQNQSLATDLAAQSHFLWWIMDSYSKESFKRFRKQIHDKLAEGHAPFQFLPKKGPRYFEQFGWQETEFRSFLYEAKKLRRYPQVSWIEKFFYALAPRKKKKEWERWAGIAVLGRK